TSLTSFINTSEPLFKNVAKGFPLLPASPVDKPINTEKTIKAIIFSPENSSIKSGTVNVLTSCSPKDRLSTSSGVSNGIFASDPGLKITDEISMNIEEIITVTTKIIIIDLIILHNRAILSILLMTEDIEKNTSRITIIKSKLINTSPNGLIIVAFSTKISPIIAPIIIEIIKIIGNRYAFNLFSIKFSPFVILFLIAQFYMKLSSFKSLVY